MVKLLSIDHDFCIQKLNSAISLAVTLESGDYPHTDSALAVKCIKAVYTEELSRLRALKAAQADTILEFCRRANVSILRMKPFIGLALRSSNLRNAFEMYFPIKKLAWEMLDSKPKVVLGSEWTYSPFTYPFSPRELSDFIFIGIPASECQNPLIVPLAAHELGHVVWNRKGTMQTFDNEIKAEVYDQYVQNISDFQAVFNRKIPKEKLASDIFAIRYMTESYTLAQRQVEETFCDFIALYVHGNAFAFAFRYLLAPSLGNLRNPQYPRISERAQNLLTAARQFDFAIEEEFPDSFSDQQPKMTPSDAFIQKMADLTAKSLVPRILKLVEDYRGHADKYVRDNEEEKQVLASIRGLVPPSNVQYSAAIINASWKLRLTIDNWKIPGKYKNKDIERIEKLRVLRDITLKSFEIFEYQCRIKQNAA